MLNKAVRFHGTNDIRLDTYTLPELHEGEVLVHVYSDSCCMSSYKAAIQGVNHKRIPKDVSEHPTIVGHEFCGEVTAISPNCETTLRIGQKVALQTTLPNTFMAPGYSYEFCGGETQYAIVPAKFIEAKNLIEYKGEGYFPGSLAEPYSCVIGAFHSNYHNVPGEYRHEMGIKENGKMLLMAATGSLGMAALDYIIHCQRKPKLIVVTGRSTGSIGRTEKVFSKEEAAKNGIELIYFNISQSDEVKSDLLKLSGGAGFDDIFTYTPDAEVIELAGKLLAFDGCLNVFAGPSVSEFYVPFNMYNVHYSFAHVCGISGGNGDDMREAIEMMGEGKLTPQALISHVGGLDAAPDTTLRLPEIRGGKKLIYTNISMPLTAIADFAKLGESDPIMAALAEICDRNNGLWSVEAEKYLLSAAQRI